MIHAESTLSQGDRHPLHHKGFCEWIQTDNSHETNEDKSAAIYM